MRDRGLQIVMGGLLVLLLVACQGGADDDGMRPVASEPEPTAEPIVEPTPTPVPTPEDPYAVPDEIDVAYVQRVIDAIDEVAAQALRRTHARGEVDHQVLALLSATHRGMHWDSVVQGYVRLSEDGFTTMRDDPGGVRTEVVEIQVSSPTCVSFERRVISARPRPCVALFVRVGGGGAG